MANDRDAEPDAEPNGENADELSKVGEMSFFAYRPSLTSTRWLMHANTMKLEVETLQIQRYKRREKRKEEKKKGEERREDERRRREWQEISS